jgi:hypothetical protein
MGKWENWKKDSVEIAKMIAPVVGASVGSGILKQGQKNINNIFSNNAMTLRAERGKSALKRADSQRLLAEAIKKTKATRRLNERAFAQGNINAPALSTVGDFYADAIGKIAASSMARQSYLDDLEHSNRVTSDAQKNKFSDAQANAWASASDAAIKVAQNYESAGDVASKDATKVKEDVPEEDTPIVKPIQFTAEEQAKIDAAKKGIQQREENHWSNQMYNNMVNPE